MARRHVRQCAKKLIEEAGEFALEAVDNENDREDLIVEAADVAEKFTELLAALRISLPQVLKELRSREGAASVVKKLAIKRRGKRRRSKQ